MLLKYFLWYLLFLSVTITTVAQECGNCNNKPRISQYDLDVQVAKPADSGQAWLEWRQLFWFAKFTQAKIFEQNRNCVQFIQPLTADKQGNKILVVDHTTPILPKENTISKFADYLITGAIAKAGTGYIMHLELQTACGRKKVASAEVPFDATADPEYTMQIAGQAAMQLSPLTEKIREFSAKQRELTKNTAFSNRNAASLTIIPKKKQLISGEETEIEISLKDCDGYALGEREIVFTKGSINGMPMNGTTGGSVTPSVVTTDANGKAKAKFKMGNGKTALIYAHHRFARPSGCGDVMIGSCPIGSIPVKVEIEYETDQALEFKPSFSLGAVKFDGGEDYSTFSRFYRSVLYHYPSSPKEFLINVYEPSDEQWRTIYENRQGFFVYMRKQNEGITKLDFQGVKHQEVSIQSAFELNSGTVRAKPAEQISFSRGNGMDPMHFFLVFNFQNEDEEDEIGTGGYPASVSLYKGDKGVSITTNKIADPKSPYKTEYLIEANIKAYDPEEVDKMLGTSFGNIQGFKHTGNEVVRIRILSPYD